MTTESDRELLELAAKAAGYTLVWGDNYIVDGDNIDCTDLPYVRSDQQDEADWHWNPLTDDGDALRLAVKLQLTIKFHYGLVLIGNEKKLLADEADEDYKYAIVRAAAAIARAAHKEQT